MSENEVQELALQLREIETKVDRIETDIQGIFGKLSTYRPPWSVVCIITFLSCACVGLIVHGVK